MCSRYNFFGLGWRRPYVVIGLAVEAACFFVLTTFSPKEHFFAYVCVMVIRNCAIALADGGAEGLSVDAGVEESSGSLQAWSSEFSPLGVASEAARPHAPAATAVCGRMLGMMLSAAAGGPIAQDSGYQRCMVFLGAFILLFLPISFFVKVLRAERGRCSVSTPALFPAPQCRRSDRPSPVASRATLTPRRIASSVSLRARLQLSSLQGRPVQMR